MKADVHPLLIIHVNFGFTLKSFSFSLLWLAIRAGRNIFRLPVNKIVTRTRRNSLGKFSPMIRYQVPARSLLGNWMDRDLCAIERPVIWSVSRTKNEGVRLFFLFFVICRRLGERRQRKESKTHGGASLPALSNHCPLLLRRRLLPRRLHRARPLGSAPADVS